MGRTIHYSIFGDERIQSIPWQVRREIDLAQQMMNQRFCWTCEQLSLELSDPQALTRNDSIHKDRHARPPCLGTGFTKVGFDEWNSQLVVSFIRWVSERLPDVTVELSDEGEYVLAGSLVFRRGMPALDPVRIGKSREYLKSHGLTDALRRLDDAEDQARQGVFFAEFFASEYDDRPEIAGLELTEKELARRTLKEVAEAIPMPWQTEWLKAAA